MSLFNICKKNDSISFIFLYFIIYYSSIIRGGFMLHLNNRGWGLSVLLAFIFIFFIAILLISMVASNMGLG